MHSECRLAYYFLAQFLEKFASPVQSFALKMSFFVLKLNGNLQDQSKTVSPASSYVENKDYTNTFDLQWRVAVFSRSEAGWF